MVTKTHIHDAEVRYANLLGQYGPDNMATIRAEISWREVREAFEAQRDVKLAELCEAFLSRPHYRGS